jgi:hypothetical protein
VVRALATKHGAFAVGDVGVGARFVGGDGVEAGSVQGVEGAVVRAVDHGSRGV